MSLIDMTQFDRMDVDPEPDGHAGRRDDACDRVEGELAPRGSPRDEVAVALRSYGDGCVAVGLAGPVDRDAARRVGALLRGLRPFSTRELTLTLVLLGPWDSQLARVIGRARVHHLVDGGRLDLRGAPSGMFAAVGGRPRTPPRAPPAPTGSPASRSSDCDRERDRLPPRRGCGRTPRHPGGR